MCWFLYDMDLRYERVNKIHAGERRMNHIIIAKSKFEFNFFNTGSICPSILYIECFRTRNTRKQDHFDIARRH